MPAMSKMPTRASRPAAVVGHAVVVRSRDEVRPHEPVRRHAADGEAACQQPEDLGPRGVAQGTEGETEHTVGTSRASRGRVGRGAVRGQAEVAGVVMQPPQHERHDDEGHDASRERSRAPAVVLGQPGEHREEDQLAGRPGGREHARHESPALDEPPPGHRCDEGHRHGTGPEADEQSPRQDELPRGRHPDGQQRADADEDQGAGDDALDAQSLHQGGREGSDQPIEHEVDRDGAADDAHRPAELLVKRVHHHARCRAKAGSADDRQEGRSGDPPCRVHAGGRSRRSSARLVWPESLRRLVGDAHGHTFRDGRPEKRVARRTSCARIWP